MKENFKMNIAEKVYQLWGKPTNEDFNENEIRFLKKYIKSKNYQIKYGFYKKISASKKQIAIIFDLEPSSSKKSGAENNWEIIYQRNISELEILEFIKFYFRSSFKRFLVFYYKDLERLIIDDKKLGVETPKQFVQLCEKRGYSGEYQTKLEFHY